MRARPPSTLREAIRGYSTIKNSTLYDGDDTLWYNSNESSKETLSSNNTFIKNISLRANIFDKIITLKNPVLRADYILHKLPYVGLSNNKRRISWK